MRSDPITNEIIRNAFLACAEDMNASLIRSAYTPVIYEGRDCSVALLDQYGDVLGQSSGLPIFLGNLEVSVKATAELLGWEAFKPGDIFMLNDPYIAGTHLNDATIFGPIYWHEKLVGFTATRAHWLDVGSKDPGGPIDSFEIFQEGIRWGPTRIYENGQPRADVIDLIRRNSRFGYSVIGDLNAQVAACLTGEARFRAILDRFGYDTYLAARDEIYRQTAQLEREAVTFLPDGTYSAHGFIDNDGLGDDPIRVQVRVEVAGDQITIDLEGSSPQTPGPINSGFPQTVSACRVAFKLLIQPERPVDGGAFKTLRIKAPEDSIFSASEPAACQWFFTPLGLLIDLVVKALAPALPEKVAAAHYGDSMAIYLSLRDPRHDDRPALYVAPHAGGWGGYEGGDGEDGLINNVNGAFRDYPVEICETKYPLTVLEYGFRPDSGGPGQFRGGCGLYRRFQLDGHGSLNLWFERSVTPAWGLFGGQDGRGPDVIINPGGEDERRMLKASALPLEPGDVLLLKTGGGGGFGDAWARQPAEVREDVIDGYVTRAGAERDYGVVLQEDLTVDEDATRELRRQPSTGSAAG